MKALFRIAPIYRPYSGTSNGVRIQAAIPNNAGRKMIPTDKGMIATSREVPSFRRPYLLNESMDYPHEGAISEQDMERFFDALRFMGYSEFEQVAGKKDKPIVLPEAMRERLRAAGFTV